MLKLLLPTASLINLTSSVLHPYRSANLQWRGHSRPHVCPYAMLQRIQRLLCHVSVRVQSLQASCSLSTVCEDSCLLGEQYTKYQLDCKVSDASPLVTRDVSYGFLRLSLLQKKRIIPEEVIWGPKQGYFWNVNWVCAPQLAVSKLSTQRCSEILATPELENCQLRRTCLIARGVNPTSHHQPVISHHQLTRFVSFLYD